MVMARIIIYILLISAAGQDKLSGRNAASSSPQKNPDLGRMGQLVKLGIFGRGRVSNPKVNNLL